MSEVTCAVVAIVVVLGLLACAVACVVAFGVLSYCDVQLDERAQVRETIASEMAIRSPATLTVRNPRGSVVMRAGTPAGRIEVEATKEAHSCRSSSCLIAAGRSRLSPAANLPLDGRSLDTYRDDQVRYSRFDQ